jgi:hypothetical protein
MDWLFQNKEWLFSGIAVAIPIAVITWLFFSRLSPSRSQEQKGGHGSTNIQVGGDLNIKSQNKDE